MPTSPEASFPRFPQHKSARPHRYEPYANKSVENSHLVTASADSDPSTVSTRFLVLSDTHGNDVDSTRLPKADVVLHCGDITENGCRKDYQKALQNLCSLDAELRLVIAGNHDASLDREFYINEGGSAIEHEKVLKIWQSQQAKDAGLMLLDEGLHIFTLRSGTTFTIYTSQFTPCYGESAFQYPSGHDRFNPPTHTVDWARNVSTDRSVIPDFPAVDIVMTHGPPKYILDNCADGSSGGCDHLRRAICRAKPILHCFGHIHRDWGSQRATWKQDDDDDDDEKDIAGRKDSKGAAGCGMSQDDDVEIKCLPKEFNGLNSSRKRGYASAIRERIVHGEQTLFVNAAIMDDDGESKNVPWIVDLDLRLSTVSSLSTTVALQGV